MKRDPLYGIRLKLERACQQLHSLHSNIDAFMQRKPYGVSGEYNPKLRTLRFVATAREPFPGVWGVHVGEIVHNLRSSLDHLIWELVIHDTGAPPTVTKTQFPIFETEIGYRKRTPEFLHGAGEIARALIESLQPFRTGEGITSPLWQLLKLSDFDKHRTLHLVGAKIQGGSVHFSGLAPYTPVEATATIGPLEDGAEFLRVKFPGTKWPFANGPGDVKVEGPLGIGIVFDKGTPAVAGTGVVESIGRIGTRVYESVERIARDVLHRELQPITPAG